MLSGWGDVKRQPFSSNFLRVSASLMSVASSKGSPDAFGASTKRKNSSDLLQRYCSPRQVMSFKPLVDQFAIVVKTAPAGEGFDVFQRSVTTGCRVGSHLKPCVGTGKNSVPTFSPK